MDRVKDVFSELEMIRNISMHYLIADSLLLLLL